MGVFWYILNLDSRTSFYIGKVRRFPYEDQEEFHAMICPIPVHRTTLRFESDEVDAQYPSTNANSASLSAESCLFNTLPYDILDAIIGYLEDHLDILCISFTCQAAWYAGLRYIYAFVEPWAKGSAGHRIILIGDDAMPGLHDIPRGLELTKEEAYIMAHRCNIDLYDPDEICPCTEGEECEFEGGGLDTLADRSFGEVFPWDLGQSLITRLAERYKDGRTTNSNELAFLEKMIRKVIPNHEQRPANDEDLVLRNLSRRLYVRGDAFAAFQRKYKGMFFDDIPPRLASAALERIRWWSRYSPYHSEVLPSPDGEPPRFVLREPDVTSDRGPWAGDRFDIVSKAGFEREQAEVAADMPWTDVTVSAVEEITDIWFEEDRIIPRRQKGLYVRSI